MMGLESAQPENWQNAYVVEAVWKKNFSQLPLRRWITGLGWRTAVRAPRALGALAAAGLVPVAPLLAVGEPDRVPVEPAEGEDGDEEDAEDNADDDTGTNVGILGAIGGELAREEAVDSEQRLGAPVVVVGQQRGRELAPGQGDIHPRVSRQVDSSVSNEAQAAQYAEDNGSCGDDISPHDRGIRTGRARQGRRRGVGGVMYVSDAHVEDSRHGGPRGGVSMRTLSEIWRGMGKGRMQLACVWDVDGGF